MNLLNNRSRGGAPLGAAPLGVVVSIALTLFGCGGEGSEGSVTSSATSQNATVSAQDATYSTGYANLYEVDLSSKVLSSTGGGFTLNEVEILSHDDSCQIESKTESGFVIRAEDTKVCDYRYHVSPKTLSSMSGSGEAPMAMSDSSSEASSSAITRVAVSSDPSATELIPISETTLVNESVGVLLKEQLAKTGYSLDDQFVLTEITLPYDLGSVATIDENDLQVIDYTPPTDFTGVDRVLYTLEDVSNNLVLMGVLDIAIGYQANEGFTIEDNLIYPDTVEVLVSEDIDISDFVTSDDGDDYQLVYVEAFDAEVTAKNPLATNNKIIEFKAYSAGYHYISFGVSDHNGVYDMGLIRVDVIDPNQSAKWGDISYLADLYIGPPTAVDATNAGTVYDQLLVDDGYSPAVNMAGFRYPSAVAYCESQAASLPTVDQLKQMTANTNVQVLHGWPTQATYIAYDDATELPMWVDMADGVNNSGAVDFTDAYYVTCIKQGLMTLLPGSNTQAVADGVDVASVIVELKLGQELMSGVSVTASVDSANVSLASDSVTTNSLGIAEFDLTSFKAETVTLTLDVTGITQAYDVTFIGDETTAKVTSQATIDTVDYLSVEGAQVTATLTDQNGNPVVGYSVISTVSPEVHPDTGESVTPILEAKTPQTDESGEQKVRVKWDTNYQTPTTTMTFDVTSSYTTTTNTQTDAMSQVTYTGYKICGGQVGDNDKQNAAGDCIKITKNNGLLYTGTPSTNFLQAINYSNYNLLFTESGLYGPDHGVFGRFTQSEASQLCTQYNTIKLNGKSDWRLATRSELSRLHTDLGMMFSAKGWAVSYYYWSSTPDGSDFYYAVLRDSSNGNGSGSPSSQGYASCVSDS
ncbi:Ig-like domain-containing protein [Vibrio sp. 1CM8B]|uniref:Ig-like domain-containing protein n=1 Tax=Vibrio sp. 1CM8B TaxID=2929167 RepID=UPI0020C15BF7|nr:Ig-like domain-containing protein [Vibrio sp. 1CM8B]MCK8086006.1 Ig-like domain-containing protein [Vibrio sp. 1CM8B]